MSDDKNDNGMPVEQGEMNAEEQIATLRRAIREEMDVMMSDELERLYAVIALMEMQDDE